MHGQAEAAFEGANVVLEEVGVLFEVDGLKGKLAEALTSVGVGGGGGGNASAAKLTPCTILCSLVSVCQGYKIGELPDNPW